MAGRRNAMATILVQHASGLPTDAAQGRALGAARQPPRARHARPRPACAAAARRGSQRGSRAPPLLEQHTDAEPETSAEDSWETALLGSGGSPQRNPTAQAPSGPSGRGGGRLPPDAGPADDLSESERAELDAMAQELAAVEAERLGTLWGNPGGAPQGFDADALLAAADAAERSRGSAPGADAQPLKPGGRRRAAGGQEPPGKEVPLAMLPKARCWPGGLNTMLAICEHNGCPGDRQLHGGRWSCDDCHCVWWTSSSMPAPLYKHY